MCVPIVPPAWVRVFVSFCVVYVVVVLVLGEECTYTDDGDFFDGILVACRLVFGVFGHGDWIDIVIVCINR